jgi:hypothetical protein
MRNDRHEPNGAKNQQPERIPIDPEHRKAPHATLPGLWPLIRRFRIADGLNTITEREEIGTSVPAFGLRPIRRPFLIFFAIALFRCSLRVPITGKCASRQRNASLGSRFPL